LGFWYETALTPGRYVAGSSAHAKAKRIGIVDEAQDAAERRALAAVDALGSANRMQLRNNP